MFNILEHFRIKGDGDILYGHDLHISDAILTQEARIYMV
jgi:hypothetical protein